MAYDRDPTECGKIKTSDIKPTNFDGEKGPLKIPKIRKSRHGGYSWEVKIEVMEYLQKHSIKETVEKFRVSKQTCRRWMKETLL